MVKPKSQRLAEIEALTDPLKRLTDLAVYIKDGEDNLTAARKLRAQTVWQARMELRTWPAIVKASGGTTETYLRREMEDARRTDSTS